MTEPNGPGVPAPGWHPDPWVPGQRRYWTGSSWTSDVFPDGAHAATGGAAARPDVVSGYGPPPTTPASPPPPPPVWRADDPSPAPAQPAALPVTAPAPDRRPPWPAVVVVAAAAAIVLAALGAVLLLRPHSNGTVTAAASPSASPAPTRSPSTPAPTSPSPTPSAPTSPSPSTPRSTPTTPPTTPPGGGTSTSSLADLVVRQADVPSGYLVGTIPGGDQVQGETTLDLCNATYPSEALRTDRLQTAAVDGSGTAKLSTEAVVYQSADATAQAFRELEAAAAQCSTTSPGTTITANPDTSWGRTAGVDRIAFRYTTTDATGNRSTGLAVYLKRGNVLLGVYFPDADGAQMPVEGRTTVPAIVKLFEERLLRGGASSSSGSSSSGGIGA